MNPYSEINKSPTGNVSGCGNELWLKKTII
jgi:hypothetical protein